jgi:hypothetical protein|tara:strand:+ start:23424 stop:23912 length:489 start_codon:yes stop_codon:yes gene_type:complete
MNQLVIKFLSLALFTIISHKYYVSTTLIDFDLKTKSFEITLKVFYDDLEQALEIDSKTIDYKQDYDYLTNLYQTYLEQNFQLRINSETININYLGFEKKRDQINLYMEINNELEEDNILIKNSILFNLFPNQKNIILIRKGDFRKSFIQDKYNPTDSFSFDN